LHMPEALGFARSNVIGECLNSKEEDIKLNEFVSVYQKGKILKESEKPILGNSKWLKSWEKEGNGSKVSNSDYRDNPYLFNLDEELSLMSANKHNTSKVKLLNNKKKEDIEDRVKRILKRHNQDKELKLRGSVYKNNSNHLNEFQNSAKIGDATFDNLSASQKEEKSNYENVDKHFLAKDTNARSSTFEDNVSIQSDLVYSQSLKDYPPFDLPYVSNQMSPKTMKFTKPKANEMILTQIEDKKGQRYIGKLQISTSYFKSQMRAPVEDKTLMLRNKVSALESRLDIERMRNNELESKLSEQLIPQFLSRVENERLRIMSTHLLKLIMERKGN